jgi:hypothetical protein
MFILCTPSVTRELVIRKEQWKSQLVAFVSIYYYLVMLSSLAFSSWPRKLRSGGFRFLDHPVSDLNLVACLPRPTVRADWFGDVQQRLQGD